MSPPGDIRAYDVLTGKLVWTFHTVPRPGEFGYDTWPKDAWKYIGGVNNWGEMTIDTARGIAFIPLGSPTYDFYGADRHRRQSVRHVDRRARRAHRQAPVALPDRAPRSLGHGSQRGAAADDHPSQRAQPRRRRGHRKTGWLYVFDRVTGEPIWPIEERPCRRARWKARRAGRRSRTRPTRRRTSSTRSTSTTSARIFPRMKPRRSGPGCSRPTTRASSRRSARRIRCSVPASNGGTLFGGAAAEPRTGAVYVVAHDNPGIVRLLRPGEGRGARRSAAAAGANRLSAELPDVPRRRAAGHRHRCAARACRRRCGEQHRRRCAALRRGRDSRGARDRQEPHAAVPASQHRGRRQPRELPDAAGGRARRAAGSPGAAGQARSGSGAPPELIAGSGSAWTRPDTPGGRGRGAAPYPEGTPGYTRYTINEYNTVGNGIRPPFTTIVKYDLNEPAIKWRIRFGDDPALAARGITGPARRRLQQRHHRHRSPASCLARASTITSAHGTATRAASSGRRDSAATSRVRR